jgi:hypothetical protein
MATLDRHDASNIDRDFGQNPVDDYSIGSLGRMPVEVGTAPRHVLFHESEDEMASTATERSYWHHAYRNGLCFSTNCMYEDYAPAYRAGYVYRMRHRDHAWEQARAVLRADWEDVKGTSRLSWNEAELSVRAAWDHVATPPSDSAMHGVKH